VALNVVVCLKQIPNPDLQFQISPDGKDIRRDALNYKLNGADEYALEEAVRIKEKQGGRVVALTLGPKRTEQMLREALAKVLYGRIDGTRPPAVQLRVLERKFHAAALHRRLMTRESHLEWSWAGMERQAEIPLWMLAQAASDLLVSIDAELIKDCGDSTCRWLFLDVSKNHTRRWCDMKTCGNRMKARRFQARRAA